jgi:hypothetical protein
VLFRLEEVAATTHLTLEHWGWEAFPSSSREEPIRAHASGWSQHMANLVAYLAQTPY